MNTIIFPREKSVLKLYFAIDFFTCRQTWQSWCREGPRFSIYVTYLVSYFSRSHSINKPLPKKTQKNKCQRWRADQCIPVHEPVQRRRKWTSTGPTPATQARLLPLHGNHIVSLRTVFFLLLKSVTTSLYYKQTGNRMSASPDLYVGSKPKK